MLSWFRRKQKTNPAAWAPPADGKPRFRSLSEELALANEEARQGRGRIRTLETEVINARHERDNLKEILFTLCVHAQKAWNGGDKTTGKWPWDRKDLPSRAEIHTALIDGLTDTMNRLHHLDFRIRLHQKAESDLTEELQAMTVRAMEAEAKRRKLEGDLAYALGEVGLATDAHHLTQRKTEYLYEELQKLSPHFKNLSAEKVAAKAAKDAAKAVASPASTPAIDPPTAPEVWPVKPKR
ncbi:hypothetical protein [Methylobacterium indicum]|uniref:hypothetical protein n=1 Tax=Methylobacterium indicum TaxID=1775910 RepID=UPI000A93DED1|nr:hypothetical protein [Methylobacterium indicum]